MAFQGCWRLKAPSLQAQSKDTGLLVDRIRESFNRHLGSLMGPSCQHCLAARHTPGTLEVLGQRLHDPGRGPHRAGVNGAAGLEVSYHLRRVALWPCLSTPLSLCPSFCLSACSCVNRGMCVCAVYSWRRKGNLTPLLGNHSFWDLRKGLSWGDCPYLIDNLETGLSSSHQNTSVCSLT